MLIILTKEEQKAHRKKMLVWLKEALDGEHGVYVHNILLGLQSLEEAHKRDKV